MMRKLGSHSLGKKLALLLCFCPPLLPLAADEEIQLSLGDALMRVESENLEVLLNREAIEQALATAKRERSPLFPQVDLEASQVRSQVVNIGRGFDAPGTPPGNRFDARVVGSVPLVDPFLIAAYRAARVGVEVSEYEHQRVLQEVLNSAALVYLSHLRNVRRFEVIQSNIDRGEALLDLAREQFDVGVATRIDVTRAEVQLAFDEQSRLQQETEVFESELFLKRLLNLDLRAPVEVRDFMASRFLPTAEPDVEVDQVLPDRPEFLRARSQLEQNRLERRAAGWERFPVIRGFGDYGYVSERAFDGSSESAWTVGVTATLPLFEGFRIRANKDLADSRIRATRYELEQIEQNVSSDLLLAWQDMRSRLAQITVAEQNVDLSEEELSLGRVRFEQGVADNREIIDAQNRLAIAEDNLVEAIHQYNLSRLEYARSKGDVRLLLADQMVGE